MYQKSILYALFLSLFISIALAPAFAALEFESGPLQEKALDEREQEEVKATVTWPIFKGGKNISKKNI